MLFAKASLEPVPHQLPKPWVARAPFEWQICKNSAVGTLTELGLQFQGIACAKESSFIGVQHDATQLDMKQQVWLMGCWVDGPTTTSDLINLD